MSEAATRLPWLAGPLHRALANQNGHALLVHGPRGVGQLELALALAEAWLCENDTIPRTARPCGTCASCRLVRARSHPDLLVLIPDALRESLGWAAAGEEGEEGGKSGRKPSKEIRVEAIRAAVAFATTTSARGLGKAVVVHPAERMNAVAANAFLKTLEEPAGQARFILCSSAPDALLPTLRSRCQALALPVPPTDEAAGWLEARGIAEAAVLLAGAGGQPEEVLTWRALGIDAAIWRAVPGRVVRGEAGAFHGWPLPLVVEALQKLCHDAAARACGASPRYFPVEVVPAGAGLAALLGWSRALSSIAAEAEHPWLADLSIESLVEQGRQALKTPRSQARPPGAVSLNSAR
jgi:DNA polymerase-3 subunit delta'